MARIKLTVKSPLRQSGGSILTAVEMNRIAEEGVAGIVTRTGPLTTAGRDKDGRPFKRLTNRYAKQKAKRGYSPVPNLRVSGSLLGSVIVSDSSDEKATIKIETPAERKKASGLKAQGRDFFGFDPKQEAELKQFIREQIRDRLKVLKVK